MSLFRSAVVTFLTASIVLGTGCSAFKPGTQMVTVQSTDPAAEIYIDGAPKGKGTVVTPLKRNRSHAVMAKAGDRTGVAQIGKSISTAGVLDIIGTAIFLVPVIGVFTPGFYDLDETHVNVVVPN